MSALVEHGHIFDRTRGKTMNGSTQLPDTVALLHNDKNERIHARYIFPHYFARAISLMPGDGYHFSRPLHDPRNLDR